MTRTALRDRELPPYTRGEEVANMVTHIVGGSLGVIILALCVVTAVLHHNPWAVVGGAIYGGSTILLYTVSSVYHGLKPCTGKKVMQVIDHCTIYLMIAGTYTPILLAAIRPRYPGVAWAIFGAEWALTAFAVTLTAIDLEKYKRLSMACYIAMGWCIVLAAYPTIQTISLAGFIWLVLGGVSYTIGAVLYAHGRKKRYLHTVFHVFVDIGTVLQAVCILLYVM